MAEITPAFRRSTSSAIARQARRITVGKKPTYVTASRRYTMRDLAEEIQKGTDLGVHYVEDMLKAASIELDAKRATLKPGETREEALQRIVLERLSAY